MELNSLGWCSDKLSKPIFFDKEFTGDKQSPFCLKILAYQNTAHVFILPDLFSKYLGPIINFVIHIKSKYILGRKIFDYFVGVFIILFHLSDKFPIPTIHQSCKIGICLII